MKLLSSLLTKVINLFNYLHDPYLVSAFQNYFGVYRIDSFKNGNGGYTTSGRNASSSTFGFQDKTCVQNGTHRRANGSAGSTLEKEERKQAYRIESMFWYYVFSFGTSLGYEMFYASFFPFWVWNLNSAVCRRVVNVWVFVMYIGQALKDVICWPRPSSPPVAHMEPKYVQEYGMPSTHAMVSVALPFSFLYFTLQRYEYHIALGLVICCAWCVLVCCSRLYMGMHTVLDLLGGLLLAPILMLMFLPLADAIDEFQMVNGYSPIVTAAVMLVLQIFYPKTQHYTPARGDTAVIMGTGTGFAFGTCLNYWLGVCHAPAPLSVLQPVTWPSVHFVVMCLIRAVIGILCIVIARAVFKNGMYKMACYVNGLDPKDPLCRQKTRVEVPYKFVTYIVIGFVITHVAPLVFRLMGIERTSMYMEV